jgi:hypothetical protein
MSAFSPLDPLNRNRNEDRALWRFSRLNSKVAASMAPFSPGRTMTFIFLRPIPSYVLWRGTPRELYAFISTTILPMARRELMASKASKNLSNGKTIVGGASTAPVSSQAAMSFLRRS